MKAGEFLKKAEQCLVNRGINYDAKNGERSISKVVKCFNEITGKHITNEEGWMFMTLLKIVRSQQGESKEDNFVDGAAYFSLMGEESINYKKQPNTKG